MATDATRATTGETIREHDDDTDDDDDGGGGDDDDDGDNSESPTCDMEIIPNAARALRAAPTRW